MHVDPQAARIAYLKWLASANPTVYAQAVRMGTSGNSGNLGRLGQLGWINFVIQAAAAIGSALSAKKKKKKAAAKAKKELAAQSMRDATAVKIDAARVANAVAGATLKTNMQLLLLDTNSRRAQAGLPPVDASGHLVNTAILPTPQALVPYVAPGARGPVAGFSVMSVLPWVFGAGVIWLLWRRS